jgi:hypothetical protein
MVAEAKVIRLIEPVNISKRNSRRNVLINPLRLPNNIAGLYFNCCMKVIIRVSLPLRCALRRIISPMRRRNDTHSSESSDIWNLPFQIHQNISHNNRLTASS